MKPTKENLITTLKAMEDVTISMKKADSKKSEIKSYYNGRLDTISVIIMMLQDEEMFESMSDDLVKNTDTIKKEIEKYAEK